MDHGRKKTQDLQIVLDQLMQRYALRVKEMDVISTAMIDQGIVSRTDLMDLDHLAFRTMGVPNLGINSFEKVFLHYGYTKRFQYYFPEKQLDAHWFAPPSAELPRIFVSKLRVGDLSEPIQRIIRKHTKEVASDPVDDLDLNEPMAVAEFLHGPLWSLPTMEEYEIVAKESAYGAWLLYNRSFLNHYSISVDDLPIHLNTLERFNRFLEDIGVELNQNGGIIKPSPDGMLLQSCTPVSMVNAEFACGGVKEIPDSCLEILERKVLPQFAHLPANEITRAHRRDGFAVNSADRIFGNALGMYADRSFAA